MANRLLPPLDYQFGGLLQGEIRPICEGLGPNFLCFLLDISCGAKLLLGLRPAIFAVIIARVNLLILFQKNQKFMNDKP